MDTIIKAENADLERTKAYVELGENGPTNDLPSDTHAEGPSMKQEAVDQQHIGTTQLPAHTSWRPSVGAGKAVPSSSGIGTVARPRAYSLRNTPARMCYYVRRERARHFAQHLRGGVGGGEGIVKSEALSSHRGGGVGGGEGIVKSEPLRSHRGGGEGVAKTEAMKNTIKAERGVVTEFRLNVSKPMIKGEKFLPTADSIVTGEKGRVHAKTCKPSKKRARYSRECDMGKSVKLETGGPASAAALANGLSNSIFDPIVCSDSEYDSDELIPPDVMRRKRERREKRRHAEISRAREVIEIVCAFSMLAYFSLQCVLQDVKNLTIY